MLRVQVGIAACDNANYNEVFCRITKVFALIGVYSMGIPLILFIHAQSYNLSINLL